MRKARDLAKVVGQIGVHHDDVVPVGDVEAGEIRASVTSARLLDDDSSCTARKIPAAVGGAIVHDDDLAGEPALLQHTLRTSDAFHDGLSLVEARNDDGYATADWSCCGHGHGLGSKDMGHARLHRL